jgi:hypothetical protein
VNALVIIEIWYHCANCYSHISWYQSTCPCAWASRRILISADISLRVPVLERHDVFSYQLISVYVSLCLSVTTYSYISWYQSTRPCAWASRRILDFGTRQKDLLDVSATLRPGKKAPSSYRIGESLWRKIKII